MMIETILIIAAFILFVLAAISIPVLKSIASAIYHHARH